MELMPSREPVAQGLEARGGDFYWALGHAIKVARTERGLERKELARLSRLSYPYVSEIEAGTKRASTESVQAIARVLGLAPSELLQRAERSLEMRVLADTTEAASQRPMAMARPSAAAYRLAARPASSPSKNELKELASRAGRLAADDFHRVLDLVRRLTR